MIPALTMVTVPSLCWVIEMGGQPLIGVPSLLCAHVLRIT